MEWRDDAKWKRKMVVVAQAQARVAKGYGLLRRPE